VGGGGGGGGGGYISITTAPFPNQTFFFFSIKLIISLKLIFSC